MCELKFRWPIFKMLASNLCGVCPSESAVYWERCLPEKVSSFVASSMPMPWSYVLPVHCLSPVPGALLPGFNMSSTCGRSERWELAEAGRGRVTLSSRFNEHTQCFIPYGVWRGWHYCPHVFSLRLRGRAWDVPHCFWKSLPPWSVYTTFLLPASPSILSLDIALISSLPNVLTAQGYVEILVKLNKLLTIEF